MYLLIIKSFAEILNLHINGNIPNFLPCVRNDNLSNHGEIISYVLKWNIFVVIFFQISLFDIYCAFYVSSSFYYALYIY